MVVLWAQLIIDGKEYGVCPFIVPLRDPQTYDLLPGVIIGDCGPKNALNNIDNGFIRLDNVLIPKLTYLVSLDILMKMVDLLVKFNLFRKDLECT